VDAKRNTINKVTVSIYNEDYVVKGNEDPEYIHMLGSYVDRRMRMIGQRNHNLSTAKVAVLTALNLADELNKLQEDYDQMIKALEEEKKNRLGQS
jgi:cell division protein ZapA